MKRINKKQRTLLEIHRELSVRENNIKDKEDVMKLLVHKINNSLKDYEDNYCICDILGIPKTITELRRQERKSQSDKDLVIEKVAQKNTIINHLSGIIDEQQSKIDSLTSDKIKYQEFIIKFGKE